jgi:hypothetical protein
VSRRRFIGAGVAGVFGPGLAFAQAPAGRAEAGLSGDERKAVASIRDKARMAKLGPLRLHAGDQFLVIGEASDDFQGEVLGFCEKLGKAFLSYYKTKGFEVDYPDTRMMVVVLNSRESYGAWIGEPAVKAIGGHYDRDANRLVVFDFRNEPGGLGQQAKVINSFTLSHEANHLLAFNTGLLSRTADIPTFIIEGLATVGELYQKTGHSAIGGFNKPRIGELAAAIRGGEPWLDLQSLLANDELCDDPRTYQLAYAESWLLISTMIKKPDQLAKLRIYLDRLKKSGEKADRLRDAEAAFGSLDRLNRELKIAAKAYMR